MSKKTQTFLTAALAAALSTGLACSGCTGGGSPSSAGGTAPATEGGAAPAASAAPIDPATAGTIKVTVKFSGTAPTMDNVDMGTEKVCQTAHPDGLKAETVIVNPDGTVANCFVYVKSGLGDRKFDVPKDPIVFDQKGCQYSPHVFGIQAGQPLKILNSDPLLHNIHATAKQNDGFNEGMPNQGMEITKVFKKPEVPVKIRCDVHSWMNAFAGVCAHPYFGVTDKTGTVELKPLPPGDYTIELWHEKYGAQTQKVTVGQKETKAIEFTLKG
jgi:hypothetical protein